MEQIFTGDVTDWSAVGGSAGKISVYTRNTSSGTYSDFKELAMKKRDYAPSSQKMAGNEQIASEVGKNPNGIGYVGLAYTNASGVKTMPIDGVLPDRAKCAREDLSLRASYLLLHQWRAERPREGVPRLHHQQAGTEDRHASWLCSHSLIQRPTVRLSGKPAGRNLSGLSIIFFLLYPLIKHRK